MGKNTTIEGPKHNSGLSQNDTRKQAEENQEATDAPGVFEDSAVVLGRHVGTVLVDVIPLASYSLHVSLASS